MLSIGEIHNAIRNQGYFCLIDDFEEKAVRVDGTKPTWEYYIKRKGDTEVLSNHYHAEKYLCELNNRLVCREEYDAY